MRILITLLFLLSTSAFAEVSKEEASQIIDEMVKSNMISAEEAEKAKVRLVGMNGQEWSALNRDAEEKASRMPASVSVADPSEDLGSQQFAAIESDLKVIAPEVVVPQVEIPQVHIPQVHIPQVQHPVVHVPGSTHGHN